MPSVTVGISIVADNIGPAQQQRSTAAAFERVHASVPHQRVPEPVALPLVTPRHIVRDNVCTHAGEEPRPVACACAELDQRTKREQGLQSIMVGNRPREVAAYARAPVEALLNHRNAAFRRQGRVRGQMTMKGHQRIHVPC